MVGFPPSALFDMQTLNLAALAGMGKLARVQLATSLPGIKPISLIGTIDRAGRTNLAPFSSILHLGSEPAFLGMVSRPDLVERHTLSNIIEIGAWTINHLHPEIVTMAHQCSARYPREDSEFTATGLTPHFEVDFPAPFVNESRFRIGLTLEDLIPIPANDTQLIVGRVVLIQLADGLLLDHGGIDFSKMECVASSALDTYFTAQPLVRYSYAKPDQALTEI